MAKRLIALGSAIGLLALGSIAGVGTTASASTIVSTACGVVAPKSNCYTPYSSYGGNRRTLFRLVNGPGVSHQAYLLDTFGSGTAQDVYSGCVNTGSNIRGRGFNNSQSGHNYNIYQVTGC